MKKVLSISENTIGTDYVVGDIHGMFDLLEAELATIGFNKTTDRLFCTGDLVDRGIASEKVIQYLSEPWFFSCIGNHDAQYAFYGKKLPINYASFVCSPSDDWFTCITQTEKTSIFNALFDALYPAIEVQTSIGLVGIVHGGIPFGRTWKSLVHDLNVPCYNTLLACIWDRESARYALQSEGINPNNFVVPDVHHVFHGHTPDIHGQCAPYSLGNRYFIDTGAYLTQYPHKYPDAKLTIVPLIWTM